MDIGSIPIRILLIIVTAAFLTVPGPAVASLRPGQPAPDFKAVITSGQSVSLSNYRGQVLILDFFATWCQPCRQSIPHLIEMNRKYGKQGLQILGLSVDEDGEQAVKSFSEELRVNYPMALAGDKTSVTYGIRSVPVMYIIDKKGKISDVYRGFTNETARSVEQSIKRLLLDR
jgi:peroxiredoxin